MGVRALKGQPWVCESLKDSYGESGPGRKGRLNYVEVKSLGLRLYEEWVLTTGRDSSERVGIRVAFPKGSAT